MRSKPEHRDLGPLGERLAARFLKKQRRMKILERGYRALGAEIDIVARDGDCIVFVEVKTLESDAFGDPDERVDASKRRHLSRAAAAYAKHKRLANVNMRFDVVAILHGEGDPRLEHYPDAFELHPAHEA